MMKVFYVCHVELERNVGNTTYTKIFKTLEEAKEEKERINSYNSNEKPCLRDSYCWRISRHVFKHINEKFNDMNEGYFAQHGEYAYDIWSR